MSNTLFQIPNYQINNYEKTLDDLIITKNKLSRTSAILEEKETEKNSLLNILYEMKTDNDNLKKENEKKKKKFLH